MRGYFGWASTAGDVVRADGAVGKDGISEILVGAFQTYQRWTAAGPPC